MYKVQPKLLCPQLKNHHRHQQDQLASLVNPIKAILFTRVVQKTSPLWDDSNPFCTNKENTIRWHRQSLGSQGPSYNFPKTAFKLLKIGFSAPKRKNIVSLGLWTHRFQGKLWGEIFVSGFLGVSKAKLKHPGPVVPSSDLRLCFECTGLHY